jgi:hypothetical protein
MPRIMKRDLKKLLTAGRKMDTIKDRVLPAVRQGAWKMSS